MAGFDDIDRVIVRVPNWLGDVVMSLPAVRALRRRFSGSHLAVMVQEKLADFYEGTDLCDEVFAFTRPVRGVLAGNAERQSLYSSLRAGRWDLGVILPNSFSSAWYFYCGDVARRAGYPVNWRGLTLTDRVPMAHGPLDRHQVHYYLDIAAHLGTEGSPDDYLYEPAAGAVDEAKALLSTIGIEPGEAFVTMAPAAAYGPAKEWPARHYAELARMLLDEQELSIVLVGAPSEAPKCDEVAAIAQDQGAVSAAGKTTIAQLAAVFKLSQGFVGNDSGAMHLAGVVGIPAVGIFGSTQPGVTGPLGPKIRTLQVDVPCGPCLKRTCHLGTYECLDAIIPAMAAGALAELRNAVPEEAP